MNNKKFFIVVLLLAGLTDLLAAPRGGGEQRGGGGRGGSGSRSGGASFVGSGAGSGARSGVSRGYAGGVGRGAGAIGVGGASRAGYNRASVYRGGQVRPGQYSQNFGRNTGATSLNRQRFTAGGSNFAAARRVGPGRGTFGGAGRQNINTRNVQALRNRMGNPRNPQLAKSLSPNRTFSNKHSKFNQYRSANHMHKQHNFFNKGHYKGHNWNWWYNNNPYFFYSYFPSYFYSNYGYYPPIYYDFYDAYGFYPVSNYGSVNTYPTEYVQEPVYTDQYAFQAQGGFNPRACVADCLINTGNSLDACLGSCTAAA